MPSRRATRSTEVRIAAARSVAARSRPNRNVRRSRSCDRASSHSSRSSLRRWITASVCSTPSCNVRATSSRARTLEISPSASRSRAATVPAAIAANAKSAAFDAADTDQSTESRRMLSPTKLAMAAAAAASSPPRTPHTTAAVMMPAAGQAHGSDCWRAGSYTTPSSRSSPRPTVSSRTTNQRANAAAASRAARSVAIAVIAVATANEPIANHRWSS